MAGSSAKKLQDGSMPDAYKQILDSAYEVISEKEDGDAADGELISIGIREACMGRTVEETLACVGYVGLIDYYFFKEYVNVYMCMHTD